MSSGDELTPEEAQLAEQLAEEWHEDGGIPDGPLRAPAKSFPEGSESRKRAERYRRRQKIRLEANYDGIRGTLPDWVPASAAQRFKLLRSKMLDEWRYSPKTAKQWLDRFVTIGEKDSAWFYPAKHPNGGEVDNEAFLETVEYLAHVRWVVSIGPDRGLGELAGPDAALGWRHREAQRKKGAKEKGDPLAKEINTIVKGYLRITKPELLERLGKKVGNGHIMDVTPTHIVVSPSGFQDDAISYPISGLSSRLSRAKRKLKNPKKYNT